MPHPKTKNRLKATQSFSVLINSMIFLFDVLLILKS